MTCSLPCSTLLKLSQETFQTLGWAEGKVQGEAGCVIRPSVLPLLDLSCPSRSGNRDPTLDIILQELKIDCWTRSYVSKGRKRELTTQFSWVNMKRKEQVRDTQIGDKP